MKGATTHILAGNHAHVRYFRACFELGKAIEQHLDELNLALLGEQDGEPLALFLKDCSRRWLDDHVKQIAKLDYAGSIEFIRARIRADLPIAPAQRAVVCERIAASLTATEPEDLDRYLCGESERAHAMTGRAASELGGPNAAERWQACECASLDYRDLADVTRCSFELRGGRPVIVVHIGKHSDAASHPRKGSLRLHFCFLFFCFHEYLSHAFSRWGRRDFVDGYLFWAARQLFPKLTSGIMHHTLVEETFAQHDSPSLYGIDAIARWIDNVTPGDSFVRFLIAWAAEPVSDDFDATLDALRYFQRNRPDTGSIVLLCTILEQPHHAIARADLRALGRRSGNLPPNYTPTL